MARSRMRFATLCSSMRLLTAADTHERGRRQRHPQRHTAGTARGLSRERVRDAAGVLAARRSGPPSVEHHTERDEQRAVTIGFVRSCSGLMM